jgi:hypothetical protein
MMRWPIETLSRVLRVSSLVRVLRPKVAIGNWITRSTGLYCAIAGVHPLLAVVWGSDSLLEAKKTCILRVFGQFTLKLADAVIVDIEVQRKAVIELGCSPSKIYCLPGESIWKGSDLGNPRSEMNFVG